MPRAPLPAPGVIRRSEMSRISSEGVTPPSSLIRTHASDQNPPYRFRCPYTEGLCRLLSAPAGSWPFPTLSPRVFSWMPRPMPRWLVEVHLPVSSLHDDGLPHGITGSALPPHSAQQLQSGKAFRGCSQFVMFRPPGLLATPVAPTVVAIASRRPWRLRSSRTCVVTSASIEYASRPKRATDGRGLSPHKTRGLVGRSYPGAFSDLVFGLQWRRIGGWCLRYASLEEP